MADIYQDYGADIQLSAQGDLLSVIGATMTQQRVIRRLLTNPGDDVFNPEYGAGLGRFVGENLSEDLYQDIKNTCVTQILKEDSVAKNPRPVVTISIIESGSQQVPQVNIQYYDLELQQTVYLTFNVE